MTDYPDRVWSKPQLLDRLSYIADLFQSPTFGLTTPFTRQSQADWIDLIREVGDLVNQAKRWGHRIAFTDEVSTGEATQDITSLLESMCQSAFVITSGQAPTDLTIIYPTFNHWYGAGIGYFANGVYFNCSHRRELAFFINQDRIYFYRHLMRAYLEAGHYLIMP